ncbi:MAG: ABC transporter ATP-binding protein [Lachnospiraceae bacterium]|nr:ABC transporter ATP-binding protein [Parasporobacterium sp.]MBR4169893.1 ABC transporter ATP-binding protein [Lachnospiraceae bacterium]MCR4685332.1 ABC transporter ATP-binding protein [Lachnospiraceae bacterium]
MLDVIDLNLEFHDHLIPETVVYDFDLHMDEGDIVGIVGESGSGKSMSALAIAGLLSRKDMQKRGKILYGGLNLLSCSRTELRRLQGKEIGMVFQEPMHSLNPLRRIGWQVEEALLLHTDLSSVQRKERAIRMLQDVELKDVERIYRAYPHELSGGQRQRVMLAAALICNPKLLIADEITTALDVTVQASILELLKRFNKERGVSILFISHDLNLVRKLCDRVLVMQKGRVVEEGMTEELFAAPKTEYTKELLESIPQFRKL